MTSVEIKNIEHLLSNHLTPTAKILKQDIKILTAPGENYGSVMQAVDITIQELNNETDTLHLVAKRKPANEVLCAAFQIQETFKKEINTYVQIIPMLERFDKEYGSGLCEYGDLFARCYGARINLNPGSDYVDDDAVILLENLKVIGYEVADRLVGFTEEQVYLILDDLAKFHAVPFAFKLKKPEEFKIIENLLTGIRINDGFNDNTKGRFLKEILDVIEDVEECKPYIETIKNCIDTCLNDYGLLDPPIGLFTTMIHTDMWVNNTMILKNHLGKPVKNKIVDLQLPVFNSSTRDLIFFLYSSVHPSVLYKNLDKFIRYYFDKFIRYLSEYNLDLNLFSWENFQDDINKNAFANLGHILIMYKPILTKRGVIDDMSNFDIETMLQTDVVTDDFGDRIKGCVLSFIENKWI